ncbi:type VI secretion system protein TssA [Sphingomonas montana]|uniref:type VI secretion system protein TssA n=1 Tax=Sphingomonas montana TaxID=1843236 RepID=UPI0013E9E642|nr:type VI secretion system protein TssA [Sphingomonas montana]
MDDRFAIATLVAPLDDATILDAGPAGVDLRAGGPGSELYLRLKDLRAMARSAEREAISAADPEIDPLRAGQHYWQEVVESGHALLAGVAKDLQVASWMCEAWLRTDGFAGLAAGLALLADLIELYWDAGLYPLEDEDGVETRLAALFGLFGRGDAALLLQPIKLLPLSDHGDPPVALWTAEIAQAVTVRHDDPEMREQLVDRRNKGIAAIGEDIARASPAFVGEQLVALELALAELDRLMAAIDMRTDIGRFGSQVAQPLETALALLREHGHAPHRAVADTPAIDASDGAAPAPAGTAAARPDPARDRATALATLLDIAAFFERHEPQSLTGSSLREVVRRANLPLDMLMAELLPSSEQRTMFLLRAGIRSSREDTDSY